MNLPKSSKAKNTNKKCNTEKKNNTNEAHESFNYFLFRPISMKT